MHLNYREAEKERQILLKAKLHVDRSVAKRTQQVVVNLSEQGTDLGRKNDWTYSWVSTAVWLRTATSASTVEPKHRLNEKVQTCTCGLLF